MTRLETSADKKSSRRNEYVYDFVDDLSIPPERRVYVNRNLRLSKIKAVGFDLDHTLAHYDQLAVGKLAFSASKRKLVENKNYPREILSLSYDPDFLIRGLVVDLERGNVLKMDCHNYVQRAYHGRNSLSSSERKSIYASSRLSFPKNSYTTIDTLFHIPEVYLFISLVEFFENRGDKPDFRKLFLDIREMIDLAHRDGSIKRIITSEPQRYIQADTMIFDVFEKLRENNKKLFLLTNSEPDYTDALLQHTLSLSNNRSAWRDYFDIIVTKASKPLFFSKRKTKAVCVSRDSNSPDLCRNAYELEKHLRCRADSILYFGDHTYGDILKAKKVMGWRTAMIVPELEEEIGSALKIRKAYNRLVRLSAQRQAAEKEKAELDKDLSEEGQSEQSIELARSQSLEELIQSLSEEIDNLESICQFSYNSNWGSVFREGKQISRFAHQVRDFACIYMHKVSNLLNYPPEHYFQSYVDFMPHEFYL